MRIAYLDCFSGISGDMFLGALLDAGVPGKLFEKSVAALNVGARLEISRVKRGGIAATKVDVWSGGEKDLPREVYWEQKRRAQEHSEHRHSHGAEPVQLLEHNYGSHELERASHQLERGDDHAHKHGRGLPEIREIIGRAELPEQARKSAISIFEALGAAEAKIHDTDVDKVHFHEVGAVDAMVDIVCAAVGCHALDVDEVVCSPLNVGSGTVQCAHGILPVPAPATVELLRNAPVYSTGIQAELVTPTGAAIVKTLAKRYSAFPQMKVENCGYGAGSRDFPGQPNVLRLTIGEAQREEAVPNDVVAVLEANIDDLNPQVFGYVMDRLFEEGALDAFGIPVQMKKNRPGMILTVLCRPEDAGKLQDLIFTETTTIGIRRREEKREVLSRKLITVDTQWGVVRMKLASMNGTVTNFAPEYEDCRKIASEHHVPLKTVMQEALRQYAAEKVK